MTSRSFTPRPKGRKRRTVDKPHPGYDGGLEIGSRVVDDPYEPGAKITVPANVATDPLLRMHNAKEIDDAQYLAGERFRHLIERAGGVGAPCADWTRPFVDKSVSFREPALTQLQAGMELKRAWMLLGWQNYRIVHGVVFSGLNGTMIAQARGDINERKAIKRAVREGLEQLAVMWGYLSGPQYVNKHASIMAYLNETPAWPHAEREIEIQYAEREKRKRA